MYLPDESLAFADHHKLVRGHQLEPVAPARSG
ncbi:MAG: hypothetical protein JWO80_1453, partial [Bryobacterales bacterium]|nr:hypothetical protein [Bryobacterales bacterium]